MGFFVVIGYDGKYWGLEIVIGRFILFDIFFSIN